MNFSQALTISLVIDPNKTSKGVQKLRDREANEGNQMVFESRRAEDQDPLEDLAAGDKESYPLGPMRQVDFSTSLAMDSTSDSLAPEGYGQSFSAAISRSSLPSMMSRKSVGVMDWSRSAPGAAQWERTLWYVPSHQSLDEAKLAGFVTGKSLRWATLFFCAIMNKCRPISLSYPLPIRMPFVLLRPRT